MASGSHIEWTEATWNPIAGCKAVSPGCTNCYAQRMAARLQAMGQEKYAGTTRRSGRRHVWTGRVNFDPHALEAPLTWKKPRRVFVNSMSDLFQEQVGKETVSKIWSVMGRAHWHTFQVLTKRPDLMLAMLSTPEFPVLSNVWLGASIESMKFIDRIAVLRNVPANIRFVSFEPLLGPIVNPTLTGIHWAIVGGESGPNARPMEPRWVEDIRRTCDEQAVAFFFKQWGGSRKKKTGRTLDGRTWDNYPAATVSP